MSPIPFEKEKKAVLVFIRAPELGMVKTRLTAHLSKPLVLELYKCLITDTLNTLSPAGFAAVLYVCPPSGVQALDTWLGGGYDIRPQGGQDLGGRMGDAFRQSFSSGITRALLVGTDIPDLPAEIYHEAFNALAEHPAVIGPALDGGYYLIGFNKSTYWPEIFKGVAWGTDRVFEQTQRIFAKQGLTPHVLPAWRDLDTYEDLAAFARRPGDTAKKTRACLRRIGLVPGIAGLS